LAEVIRFIEEGGLEHARQRELDELLERERKTHAQAAIAEATAATQTDGDGLVIRWNTGESFFSELLHSIVKAWK
jgi:hypothetical protein